MRAFGLSKDLCTEFLRKQSTIANLKDGKCFSLAVFESNIMSLFCNDKLFIINSTKVLLVALGFVETL